MSSCCTCCSTRLLQDVAELARLKILGSKLKKSATRKEPPSAVLQAMQQQRQEEAHPHALPLPLQPPPLTTENSGPLGLLGPSGNGGHLGQQGAFGDSPRVSAGVGALRGDVPSWDGVLPGGSNAGGLHHHYHHPANLSHLTSLRGAFTGLNVNYEEEEDAGVDTPLVRGWQVSGDSEGGGGTLRSEC
jgi:hypothetical protein